MMMAEGGGGPSLEKTRKVLVTSTIVIVVVLAVVVFLSIASLGPGVSASITPDLYAPAAGYGYLNESASFSINMSNYHLTTRVVSVKVDGAGEVLANKSFAIPPNSSLIVGISKVLNVTGPWTISASYDGKGIASYSFMVLASRSQAAADVAKWNGVQLTDDLAGVAIFAAFVSLGAFALVRWRRRTRMAR